MMMASILKFILTTTMSFFDNLIDFDRRHLWHFRHLYLRLFVLCIFPYLLTRAAYDGGQLLKTIPTKVGPIQGRVINLRISGLNPIVEYLGVPYAMPPLGRKRFMPPNSASKWSTAKDGTKFQPVCIQKFPNTFLSNEDEALKWMPESYYKYLQRMRNFFLQNESEDCLYLNLYVPERKGNKLNNTLPVLVLIHGGSYSWGSGNAYNGSILASYGQMIVVTLNYRLGIFGFLSAGYQAPTCRGNWALGDIAAALEFLRSTISDFGGDPKLITLMGWDTGAALVNLLMSSPVSAPTRSRSFQRAILLGGSALSSWATVSNPTDAFFYVAESLGCITLNKDQKTGRRRSEIVPEISIHDVTNCFMAASLSNITRIIRDMDPPTYLTIFGPSIDGSIVANDPQHNLREHGDLFRELDLLVGVTKNEAFHLLGNQELINGIEREKRDEIYRTLVQNLYRYHRNEIFSAIADEYTDWRMPSMQKEEIRDAVLKVLSDGLYVAPVINAARIHARPKRPFGNDDIEINYRRPTLRETATSPSSSSSTSHSSKHGNTFMYVFAHETKGLDRGRLSDSIHGEDLPYILGYPMLEQSKMESNTLFNYNYGRTEKTLSEAMMRYISNFVRTGDPTRPLPIRSLAADQDLSDALSQLVWQPFISDMREAYVELNDNPRDGLFYRAHEVAFWTKFLPSLERTGETASDERHHQFPNKSNFYGILKSLDRFIPFWQSTTTTPSITLPTSSSTSQEKTTLTAKTEEISSTAISTAPLLQDKYSTILSVTVAVGCALLILNILIFAGIYHQWDKQKRFQKRLDNHYQSQPLQQQPSRLDLNSVLPVQTVNANTLNSTMSTPVGHSPLDRSRGTSYSLASPGGQNMTNAPRMPPAPPPPAPVSSISPPLSGNSLDNDLHPTLSMRSHPGRNSIRHHQNQNQQQTPQHHIPLQAHGQIVANNQPHQQTNLADTPGTPRGLYSEQEPLLNRAFISPTCPRHGKQAAAAAAAAMAAMEEIQV